MEPGSIAAIVVAVVAALGAWAAQRSTAKANTLNARQTAEVEAYNRARAMDIKTIERQDQEFEEIKKLYDELKIKWQQLTRDNEKLNAENIALRRAHSHQLRQLHDENRALKERIERLEKQAEEDYEQ